jgi:hypothetical protein
MWISRLSALAVMATLALAPAANAKPQDLRSPDARDAAAIVDSWQGARVHNWQDLRSPDARDADAAAHAQTLQDLARLRAGNPRVAAALAQEKYYSSYGKQQAHAARYAARPADDSSPWPAIGIGLGLIVLVAGAVAVTVRTRRRTMRVAV